MGSRVRLITECNNDYTVCRVILNLNKSLLYANPDGSFREDRTLNRKRYIGIVDAVLCGEGYGPKVPDPKQLGYIIAGNNPAAIDAVSATIMGFDPLKISSIKYAFNVQHYKIANFNYDAIIVNFKGRSYRINEVPDELINGFVPASGWKNYIEKKVDN